MKQHILVVEDEIKIASILCDYLENANYRTSMLHDGSNVLAMVKKNPPDMILLDIMLPGMDGLEICRQIRKFSSLPIIAITARVEEVDVILGLELGADDYICKPFSPREVVARVKAVLRRSKSLNAGEKVVVGPICLDIDSRKAMIDKEVLALTPSEFGLLKTLMSSPNRVFSRNELLSLVQGSSFEGYDRTIDSHIKNLRKKIAKFLPGEDVIRSVYGVGYSFDWEK